MISAVPLKMRAGAPGPLARSSDCPTVVPAQGRPTALRSVLTVGISRLAAAAGADIFLPERLTPPPSAAGSALAAVRAEVDYAGTDVVTFALLRPEGLPASPAAADLPVRQHPDNPAYAVRYAHAHAASILRQAADLRVDAGRRKRSHHACSANRRSGRCSVPCPGSRNGWPGRRADSGRGSFTGTWRGWHPPATTAGRAAPRCRSAGSVRRGIPARPERGCGWWRRRGRRWRAG